jgi:hypothetical protein
MLDFPLGFYFMADRSILPLSKTHQTGQWLAGGAEP